MLKVYNIRIIKSDSSQIIRFENKLIKQESLEQFRDQEKAKYKADKIYINYRETK